MGTAATGEVVLGDHRQLDGRQDAAALERRDVDGRATGRARRAATRSAGRRALAVGGHHDAVAVGGQLGELAHDALGIAGRRGDAHRRDGGDVGALRRGGDRPGRRVGVGEQPVEGEVQPREAVVLAAGGRAPGLGQGGGEVGLLGEQVGGAVAHAARLEQEHERVGAHEVEQHVLALGEPRAASSPCRRRSGPAARRSHCSRPHGSSAISRSARSRTSSVGSSSRQPKISTRSRSSVERWSADGELGEPVDLVAPQVDADGPVGGGREHVDDRAAHGQLAAVLHHLLAAVAGADQRARSSSSRSRRSPGHDHDRLDVLDVRARGAARAPAPAPRAPGAPAPGPGAATSCAAAGPSSRPTATPARRAASPTPGRCRRRRRPGRRAGRWPRGRRRRWWGPPPRSGAGRSGWPARRWRGRAPARGRRGPRRTGRARTRSRAPHAAAGGGRGAT